MHSCNYVHGDILMKNIIFDGNNFRLIDHEMILNFKGHLRVTYPWIDAKDLRTGKITTATDKICIEATELRLFDKIGYDNFRTIPKCFYNKWGTKERINKNPNWVKNEKSNCLTTKNCHTNQYLFNEDKTLCRLLNPTEFERLQTIPEGYTSVVSNTERYKMIGNGWTVDVISFIFEQILINERTNKILWE